MQRILICLGLLWLGLNGMNAQDGPSIAQKTYRLQLEAKRLIEEESFKNAENRYDDAIALMPLKAELFYERAQLRILNKNYEGALMDFSQAVRLDPENISYRSRRGLYWFQLGDNEEALKDLNRAIRLAEEKGQDSLLLSALNRRTGVWVNIRKFENAYEDLKRVLVLNPDDPMALINISHVLVSLKRGDEGVPYLERIIELQPENVAAVANLGWYWLSVEEWEKAIERYSQAIEMDPKVGLAYNNRGYAKFMMGDLKAGLKDVEKGLKLDPNNTYGYRNRALIFIELGKIKKACEDIQSALDTGFTQRYGDEMKKMKEEFCR